MRYALALLMALSAVLAAQDSGTGVGIILGSPSGLSLKHWLSGSSAIAGGLAWSLSEHEELYIHADYLVHTRGPESLPTYMRLRYGLGGRLILLDEDHHDDDHLLGIRLPLGVCFFLKDAPLDIFLELVPVLDLIPDTDFDMDGGLGCRFYF